MSDHSYKCLSPFDITRSGLAAKKSAYKILIRSCDQNSNAGTIYTPFVMWLI